MTKFKKEDEVLNNDKNDKNTAASDTSIKMAGVNAKPSKNNTKNLEESLCENLELMTTSFSQGAKRWLSIYYTSMFAFVLLASYGFFLIYSLTTDVRRVADNMDQIVVSMSQISTDLDTVSNNTTGMINTMTTQSKYMHEMVYYMRDMNVAMAQIRYDMSVMNNSVSRPMQFMNTFMPW